MRELTLITLALMLVFVPASAMTVTDAKISPDGNVLALMPVSSAFVINPSLSGEYTMSPDRSILITTDLETARWAVNVTLDGFPGEDRISEGNTLTIPGWQVAYPVGTKEKITVRLSGISPNVSETKTVNVFSAVELMPDGSRIEGTEQSFGKLVINAADLGYITKQHEKDLLQLKAEINKYNVSWKGNGISPAQTLYDQAAGNIEYLKTLRPDQYVYGLERSRETRDAILASYDALDRQESQIHIDNASYKIRNVSLVIDWFRKTNQTGYPGFTSLTKRYDNATALLSQASREQGLKEWAAAITDADTALNISSVALTDAVILQKRAGDPLTPLWDNLFWIGVALGLCIVYIMFRRPKKKKKMPVQQP